jgi:hypothetical protein
MAGHCRVDPAAARELNDRRSRNGLADVTLILRADLVPSPPLTREKFNRYERMVEDILDRVTERVGPGGDEAYRPHVEWLTVDPWRNACVLTARVRFIDELLKEPEVVECLDGLAHHLLEERKGVGLD